MNAHHGAYRFAAGVLLALLAACGPAPSLTDGPPPVVVVVTLDTLRADHLGVYGYPREPAPFLASLAQRGVVFERAISTHSSTTPAHVSLFTGLQVPQHKITTNAQPALPAPVRTLAELFRDAGYATAGFVSVAWLSLLDRGFETFEVVPPAPDPKSDVHHARATQVVDRALGWLAGRRSDERILLWVHLFDVHNPYRAPAAFRERMSVGDGDTREAMLRHWVDVQRKDPQVRSTLDRFVSWQERYDAEIAYVDAELERLYRAVGDQGLAADSLWVVVGDHGEGMGEHSFRWHAGAIHQEQLRVPLILHRSGAPRDGRHVAQRVHGVDLYPTLAAWIGREPAQGVPLSGRSLLPLLRDPDAQLPPADALSLQYRKGDRDTYAVQDDRYKYVVGADGTDAFYDLLRDPGELDDRVQSEPELAARWRARATALYAESAASAAHVEDVPMSTVNEDALRALGYIE